MRKENALLLGINCKLNRLMFYCLVLAICAGLISESQGADTRLGGGEFFWKRTLVCPVVDPPHKDKLSVQTSLKISSKLEVLLGDLAEKNGSLATTELYFSPLSEYSARLIVVSEWQLDKNSREDLDRLGDQAQKIFENELGIFLNR